MKPSKNAVELIKEFEGFRDKAYQDSAGIWTIGYGTIKYPNGNSVKKGDVITKGDAFECLQHEVEQKSKAVSTLTSGVLLSQNQYDALVSFTYNIGVGGFKGSTLLKKLKVNPYDPSIENEFLKWNKVRKNGELIPLDGLTNRRRREAEHYFKPVS